MTDYGNIKNVKIKVLTTAAYACIETDRVSLDVKLDAGMPAGASMRRTAAELREKAQRLLDRAQLIEMADEIYL